MLVVPDCTYTQSHRNTNAADTAVMDDGFETLLF